MSAVATTAADQIILAAQAALPLLPLPAGGEVAPASFSDIPDQWPAISRRFTGGRSGTSAVALDPAAAQALTTALAEAATAEGNAAPDLSAACLPALDAVSSSLGPTASLDPTTTTGAALAELATAGDGSAAVAVITVGGVPQAYIVLTLGAPEAGPGIPEPRSSGEGDQVPGSRGMELLRSVPMEVTAEIGRTRMTIQELLSLSPGAVVELDRPVGSPADVLVNGRLFARGEVVVVDEDFAIRITEIVDSAADSPTA